MEFLFLERVLGPCSSTQGSGRREAEGGGEFCVRRHMTRPAVVWHLDTTSVRAGVCRASGLHQTISVFECNRET